MSIDNLLDQDVEVLRAETSVDRNNGVARDWSNPTLAWSGRGRLTGSNRLYLPAAADITGVDRVRLGGVDGKTYNVLEAPLRAKDAVGDEHHLECKLGQVEGEWATSASS